MTKAHLKKLREGHMRARQRGMGAGSQHPSWNGGKKTVCCTTCGKGMVRWPSRIREHMFCSRECQGTWARSQTGEKAGAWKGGLTPLSKQIRNMEEYDAWRVAVFQAGGGKCSRCGTKKETEAHHLKTLSSILQENGITSLEDALACPEIWDVKNGVVACRKCHMNAHPNVGFPKVLSHRSRRSGSAPWRCHLRYDPQLVIDTYLRLGTIQAAARKLKIQPGTVAHYLNISDIPRVPRRLYDAAEIADFYKRLGTVSAVARKMGIPINTTRRYLSLAGIQTDHRKDVVRLRAGKPRYARGPKSHRWRGGMRQANCRYCGHIFHTRSDSQVFCSHACHYASVSRKRATA